MADALRRVLPADAAGAVTAGTLMSLLPAESRPSGKQNLLKYLCGDGITRVGRGINSDPFRFFRPPAGGV